MTTLQINQTLAVGKDWMDAAIGVVTVYGLKILAAVVIYIIGNWIIKRLTNLVSNLLGAKQFDASLQRFLISLFKVSLTVLMFLVIASQIGVDITGFAALLAGAGLAIGAALNGSLGNLAGGVMIMIFRPFKVGDMIEAQGLVGVVQEIGIFNTTMLSAENKTIILPNGALSTGVITNYTSHGNLRVDMVMAIALDMDVEKARKVAVEAMLQHPKILKTPAPEVSVLKIADGMTTLAIRPYTLQGDYWEVYFGVLEMVKKAFDSNGIAGPVPTRVLINKS
ncbi:mechanosensitive ion channel family protein [Pedobacter sp. MW01-1-1]|uniref:mechanosensitive ion channel family protein n=1 Tax=Pedobacter sp. MW01-1-1 TaxID=3383027 RepID=UPI003FEF4761